MDAKDKKIAALEAIITALQARISDLERRVGLDSSNSSKPPGSDGLQKKSRVQSLRNSNKARGGQKGHRGGTLNFVKTPDKIERHHVQVCRECEADLMNIPVASVVRRQVFDVAIKRFVTEHQAEVKQCKCGTRTTAFFPEAVKAPTQIGETLRAIALYLSEQFIGKDRLSEVMEDLFGMAISDTTLIKYESQLAGNVKPFYHETLAQLRSSAVKHQDESGIRVSGKTEWMHVLSNEELTCLWHDSKRKSLLTGLTGICVHDHYKPYLQQDGVEHAFCNAHYLRELQALIVHEKEEWASSMSALLRIMCSATKNSEQLSPEKIALFNKAYDKIIQQGLVYHESQPPPTKKVTRGRIKRRIGHNLLLRFHDFKAGTLRFLTNAEVPFTNNRAEQDLRMVKIKQKVSGCFRTPQGVKNFAIIRSFISTVKKNKLNVLKSIKLALNNAVTLSDIIPPKPQLMLPYYN